jgi:O-antigen biosynthesis protein
MDVIERLPLEAASAHTLPTLESVHRYELAAELCPGARILDLCCGTGYGSGLLARTAASVVGVDNDAATIDAAGQAIDQPNVTFEVADAHAYLRRPETGEFDVVVCFEAIEHLQDLDDALASLGRLAAAGARLILAVPNSQVLMQENGSSEPQFDFERAEDLFDSFQNVQLLYQFLAEGSLIRGSEPSAGSFPMQGRLDEHGEIEWANTYLALVNFAPDAGQSLPSGRARLALAPVHSRYMKVLERANVDLWRTNARLGRSRLGQHDTAATATMLKLRDLERRANEAERRAVNAEQRADRESANAAHRLQEIERLRGALVIAQSPSSGRVAQALRAVRGRRYGRGLMARESVLEYVDFPSATPSSGPKAASPLDIPRAPAEAQNGDAA